MISKGNVKFTDSNVKFTDSEVRMASRFASSTEQEIEKLKVTKELFYEYLKEKNIQEPHDRKGLFSSKQCIIKQLLDSVFVISRIIKVSVSVISLRLRLRLIILTSVTARAVIGQFSGPYCIVQPA